MGFSGSVRVFLSWYPWPSVIVADFPGFSVQLLSLYGILLCYQFCFLPDFDWTAEPLKSD